MDSLHLIDATSQPHAQVHVGMLKFDGCKVGMATKLHFAHYSDNKINIPTLALYPKHAREPAIAQ